MEMQTSNMPKLANLSPLAAIPQRLLVLLAPNRPAFLFASTAVLMEIVCLRLATSSIFRTGGLMLLFVPLVSAGFWFSMTWGLWGASRWIDARTACWKPWIAAICNWTCRIAVAGGLILYVASWMFYFRAGQFPNTQILQFAWKNSTCGEFWGFILRAAPGIMWGLAAFSIFALIGCSLLLRFIAGCRSTTHDAAADALGRVLIGGAYALVLGIAFLVLLCDPNHGRRSFREMDLICGLNPAITIATSVFDALKQERVEPCLDTRTMKLVAASKPNHTSASAVRPRSILFVAVESLRHDVVQLQHQGREVMPHLNQLARNGVRFTRAYAQSTHSDYSDVSVYSSLYPLRTREHHYYRKNDPWPKTLLYDVLKPAGYSTAHVSSQNERWGGMDQFLETPALDLFYDAERSSVPGRVSSLDVGLADAVKRGKLRAGVLDDAHTTDVAIEWITEQARQDRPFFLSINFQSSHFPYDIPPEAARPFEPCALDFEASFLGYPQEKTPIVRNAYYNALHESDRCLGRLMQMLDRLHLRDDTLVVVYGENGEAFHENGVVTHARAPFEPQVHVACVMQAPGLLRPAVEAYPCELIDLAPTVLGLLDMPAQAGFQGTDVLSSKRKPAEERLLFFHVENGLSRSDAVLLAGRWKLIHNRDTGRTCFFDLATDPGETQNLVAQQPEFSARLRNLLTRWRQQQLAYYLYPFYYSQYFPPAPPEWLQ